MNEAHQLPHKNPMDLSIADTCLLVSCHLHSLSTTRRAEKSTEQRVRNEESDQSITVNRHLFKEGPVRELLQRMSKAYADHVDMTAPWADKGPRILPAERFEEYSRVMNGHKEAIDIERRKVIGAWDSLVSDDIARRQQGGQKGVTRSQYPDHYKIAGSFRLVWRPQPIADSRDFRVEMPEYIKKQHEDYLQAAVDRVRYDLLKRMLEPVRAAAERLSNPIGEKHSHFKETLVGNMRDAVNAAKHLNIGNDPDVAELIIQLDSILTGDIKGTEALRTQQQHRDEVAAKLATLADQFKGMV